MALGITVPRLGWTMEEGVFHGWLKAAGSNVTPGEPLFSLEGDKAIQEVEALAGGVLRIPEDAPQTGDRVRVGELLGWIAEVGEATPARRPNVRGEEQAPPTPAIAPTGVVPPETAPGLPGSSRQERGDLRITPRAARLALARGVEPSQLRGTGRGGRIRARDVLATAQLGTPLSPTRRTLVERLRAAQGIVTPVTLTREVDVTALVAWRTLQSSDRPSVGEVFLPLVISTLRASPELNCTWSGERLVRSEAVHLSLAVDTPRGLVAPVLREAHTMPPALVMARARDLAGRARAGALRAEELQGGTFTVTNLGGLGIDAFTPVVIPPQVAILGIGRLLERPWVVAGQVLPRTTAWLSLTFDHRALDGAPAARFLAALSECLASPAPHLETRAT